MNPEQESLTLLSAEPPGMFRWLVKKAKPGTAWLAFLLSLLSFIFLGGSLYFAFQEPTPPAVQSMTWVYAQIISVIGPGGAVALGMLIALKRPRNLYGWLWLVFGLALALLQFVGSYAGQLSAIAIETTSTAVWVTMLGNGAWLLSVALSPFLMLLFPDGRLPSPRWRVVVWATVIAAVITAMLMPFLPGQSVITPIESPFSLDGEAGQFITVLIIGAVFALFACSLLSLLSLFTRYRQAGGIGRQQIKWFLYGAIPFGAAVVISGFLGQDLPGLLDVIFESATMSGLYLAVGVAIFRYRLYDIDLIINRTLVYVTLTAVIVVLYVLTVGYLGMLFQARGNLIISLLATTAVAILFAPLREKLQRTVNRLMYGERDDPYAVLARLGQRLEDTLKAEAALPILAETIAETMKLPYTAITLKRGSEFRVVASQGSPPNEPIVLPLTYQREAVGQLLLAPRGPNETFSKTDKRLLEDLARQAGVVAHAVCLALDLQRSREQLVMNREEERRRLRRDLHDSVGPQLSALTLRLDTARSRLAPNEEMHLLLEDLAQHVRHVVADIRRAVYDLRPPSLDELGLLPALRETAAKYTSGSLHISVEASTELPPLPAAVEVAVYRITLEAINNMVRHAAARKGRVDIGLDNMSGMLRLEVCDDGRGIRDSDVPGVGLASMRERAEELSGTFVVGSSRSGGTRLVALLPCPLVETTGISTV